HFLFFIAELANCGPIERDHLAFVIDDNRRIRNGIQNGAQMRLLGFKVALRLGRLLLCLAESSTRQKHQSTRDGADQRRANGKLRVVELVGCENRRSNRGENSRANEISPPIRSTQHQSRSYRQQPHETQFVTPLQTDWMQPVQSTL